MDPSCASSKEDAAARPSEQSLRETGYNAVQYK